MKYNLDAPKKIQIASVEKYTAAYDKDIRKEEVEKGKKKPGAEKLKQLTKHLISIAHAIRMEDSEFGVDNEITWQVL
jgi:hypothetical protein